MEVQISLKEARELIKLLCVEQVKMIQDNAKMQVYESEKYKRLEELKVKLKNVR